MKPDYNNWMPKGMVLTSVVATGVFLLLLLIFGCTGVASGALKTVLLIVFLIGTVVGLIASVWMALMYRAFSYDGKRQMSKQIIEGIADRVKLPVGGVGLDVGCGSGALAIACAKRNPNASFVGLDRWGKEYASYNKPLCESNAKAEGVKNVTFRRGDATKLDFPDEHFDAVVSNYVYHNIPGDRQAILLETLRVLKKGGVFLICNESDGTDETALKFEKIIDGMKCYTVDDLKAALLAAGFSEVKDEHHTEKPWITVIARK